MRLVPRIFTISWYPRGIVLSIVAWKEQYGGLYGRSQGPAKIFTPLSLKTARSTFFPLDQHLVAADGYFIVILVVVLDELQRHDAIRRTERTRTQFRAPLSVAQFLSPFGLSVTAPTVFLLTWKCHAAHDTALVRRWITPTGLGTPRRGRSAPHLGSLFGERVIFGPLVFRYSVRDTAPLISDKACRA